MARLAVGMLVMGFWVASQLQTMTGQVTRAEWYGGYAVQRQPLGTLSTASLRLACVFPSACPDMHVLHILVGALCIA